MPAIFDIFGVGRYGFSRISLLYVHIFSKAVHGTGADAILHRDMDEAVVAPPFAPGVLNDPVGLRGIIHKTDDRDAVIDLGRAIICGGEDT